AAPTPSWLPLPRRHRALLRHPTTQFRRGIELPPDLSIVDSSQGSAADYDETLMWRKLGVIG
ncbi:MAG: hypothetical protein ACREXR_05725, partial [Gammaproteobacteria bacterium]